MKVLAKEIETDEHPHGHTLAIRMDPCKTRSLYTV